MAVAQRQIVIFVGVAVAVLALAWWLLMSPIHSFPDAHSGDGRIARYSCDGDNSGKSDPATLAPWRGAKFIRDPKLGAQFLLADGQIINPSWFPAETGAIGSSMGLRWTDKSGVEKAAILVFSDVILDDGPVDVHIDIGDWKLLPNFIPRDNWAEASLYCMLDSE